MDGYFRVSEIKKIITNDLSEDLSVLLSVFGLVATAYDQNVAKNNKVKNSFLVIRKPKYS